MWDSARNVGAFGMPLFFLLSAYLIVTLLLREKHKTGTVALRAFFVRRVLRIWPLYFGMLALITLVGHLYHPASVPHSAIVAMLFLFGNVWVAKHGWYLAFIGPLWSLSVEEQFYLGIPALVRGSRRSVLQACFCAVIALSFAALIMLGGWRAVPIIQVWTNSFVQFQFFAAGGLIACWRLDHPITLRLRNRSLLMTGGLACWCVAAYACHIVSRAPVSSAALVSGYVFLMLGTLAVFLAILDVELRIPAALRYLGSITYGLYVFHGLTLWLVLQSPLSSRMPQNLGIRAALAAASTVALAAVSYQFFERPFLRLKYKFEVVHSRPA